MMMFGRYIVGGLAAAVLALAAPVQAGPILNGMIDEPSDEYAGEFADSTAPADGDMADDLDVDGVFFDVDGANFYFGLSTLAAIDTDGDESVFGDGQTHVVLGLDAGLGNFYTLRLEFAGGSVPTSITLKTGAGSPVDIAASSTVAVGDDLEVRLDKTLLPALGADFDFIGRLDGTGTDNDDVFSGTVRNLPEPASVALFAAGALMMGCRSRRRDV